MKVFTTTMQAVDQTDGKTKEYIGPKVEAKTFEEAEELCERLAPYCIVKGELQKEINS